jgi:dihydrofolate synthase / folylpolyglutamate synthase
LEKFGSNFGLERISDILRALGNPQKSLRCIVVAGSNGKGSTVEMIGCCLRADGRRVGTYFSPQVEEFPERIRIDGKNASKSEIASAYASVSRVCLKVAPKATFFEVVTAMALLIFRKRKVEFAVLEVGLGGRLDATNAVEPEISAITSISLEHTDKLGKTVQKIAHEKCGIARRGKPLVCGFLSQEAVRAVSRECKKRGAAPVFSGNEVAVKKLRRNDGAHSFSASFGGADYSVALSAHGKFQVSNACVALCACALARVPKAVIERGLRQAKPKFRLQRIGSAPATIADCAHNPEAALALASEVARMHGRKVLLFSAMRDKDYASVLSALAPEFDDIVVTEVALSRGAALSDIASAAKKAGRGVVAVKDAKGALQIARELAGKDGTLIIAGSIYILAELYGRDKIRIAQ